MQITRSQYRSFDSRRGWQCPTLLPDPTHCLPKHQINHLPRTERDSCWHHLPATQKSFVDTFMEFQCYRKRWNSPQMSVSITKDQRAYTSKIPVFKCWWQRPALLSAKVKLHFQLQTFTGSKAWAEFIINQTRGMRLSLPPKAGVGPNHQGTQAGPSDLLCVSLKQNKKCNKRDLSWLRLFLQGALFSAL